MLVGLATFAVHPAARVAGPARQRASRFYGSHTGPAWVDPRHDLRWSIVTLLLYRAAPGQHRRLPVRRRPWAFASRPLGQAAATPLGDRDQRVLIETASCSPTSAVILGFLVLVVYSKHLHIFTRPDQRRRLTRAPKALGPLLPMHPAASRSTSRSLGEDDVFGAGKIEDFTWKGMLDFATCTECGRCQYAVPGLEHRQAAVAQAA